MSAVDCLVVIPARGPANGRPRDSVRSLRGVPVIAYSIAAANAAERVSRVVVTTDDDNIAATAARHGAEVVRHIPSASLGLAAPETALLHTLDHLRRGEGYERAIVAPVQYTSPLTTGADIDAAVRTTGVDCFTAARSRRPVGAPPASLMRQASGSCGLRSAGASRFPYRR